MTDLTIVGGVYIERCIQPRWDAVYGSAGRAAEAVARLVPGQITLASYIADDTRRAAEFLASTASITLHATPSKHSVSFDYLHPLATPTIRPVPGRIIDHNPLRVSGEVVLRYGMLEGDAIVEARTAIYDPQSAFNARRFGANGSRADRLAILLNRREAASMTGLEEPKGAAEKLIHEDKASVVVVKTGSGGALLVTPDGEVLIPAYETEHVWKIGSGDVFSATFAALWGCQGIAAEQAADLASRATAYYCETRTLPGLTPAELRQLSFVPRKVGAGIVYLAAPFFDIAQRWMVEEVRALLLNLGAVVFSPVHQVGPGPAEMVAPADIEGLEGAHVVFGVLNGLDAGTIFELGYAKKKGLPIVVLAQNLKEEDLKMLAGTDCTITDDFASAIYKTIWRLPPQ